MILASSFALYNRRDVYPKKSYDMVVKQGVNYLQVRDYDAFKRAVDDKKIGYADADYIFKLRWQHGASREQTQYMVSQAVMYNKEQKQLAEKQRRIAAQQQAY